ncbi:MAG: hypothetical protein P4L73_16020 [Caulobacteraceae bacterium]|nr:hypothetical protein [Caulobacteraceae bacterium]
MFRTAATVLAFAVLGAAATANAAEVTVPAVGKSPTELRAAVTQAAYKACNQAYEDDVFIAYKREACVRESVDTALGGASQGALAANGRAVVASR